MKHFNKIKKFNSQRFFLLTFIQNVQISAPLLLNFVETFLFPEAIGRVTLTC